MPSIDLIWLSENTPAPRWPYGQVVAVLPTPQAVHAAVERYLPGTTAEAWLFWDAAQGEPDAARIEETLQRPGDAWHCGLRMGMAGLPVSMDFVDPTWMLNRDPDASIEATAWRMTLRCCLVRTSVLRALGGPNPGYHSLDAASLELGLRWIQHGAFLRNSPNLLPDQRTFGPVTLSFEDELRIVRESKGRRWFVWALLRAVLTGHTRLLSTVSAARRVKGSAAKTPHAIFEHLDRPTSPRPDTPVSVLIPTVDRYAYLRVVLGQLCAQTIPPLEVIIIDQTAPDRRDQRLQEDFPGLPLRIMTLDTPGQCTSRNLGLQHARGEYILFIDDDVEVSPDLIESHLRTIERFHCSASSGVALEPNGASLPPEFRRTRPSDVFPTNNSLLKRSILLQTGLFDPTYDHGPRADHDLGMRIYLSGGLMVLNHRISLIHYHAPAGGLRVHKARVITRDSSRIRLFQRHIPAATEIYLAIRYFSERQVREMLLQRIVATLFGEGSTSWRILKGIISLLLMPDTVRKTRINQRKARAMFAQSTIIPTFDPANGRNPAADENLVRQF